jgi:hypothetical protein
MRLASAWWVLVLCACKSAPSETSATGITTTTTTAVTNVSPPKAEPAAIAWTVPASWTTEPSTGMRKATYRIAKASGDKEDAIVTVIQAGGSVDDNVARWKAQFDGAHDVSRKDTTVNGLAITTVEVHGTYTGGGVMVGESPDPRPGWALVGVIVATAPQPYFYKMLGPDKTVAAARPDLQALVDSTYKK